MCLSKGDAQMLWSCTQGAVSRKAFGKDNTAADTAAAANHEVRS
jgi:hypothetical protein